MPSKRKRFYVAKNNVDVLPYYKAWGIFEYLPDQWIRSRVVSPYVYKRPPARIMCRALNAHYEEKRRGK